MRQKAEILQTYRELPNQREKSETENFALGGGGAEMGDEKCDV
jgi:hypothetical protein